MRFQAALAALLVTTLGCATKESSSVRQSTTRIPDAVAEVILADLREQSRGQFQPPRMRDMAIVEDSSDVVPGLVYYWGTYIPPRTGDVVVQSIALQFQGALSLLSSPTDWRRAIKDWVPSSEEQAIAACGEVASATSDNRLPGYPAKAYTGPGSIAGKSVPDSAYLVDRLSAPVAERGPDGARQVNFGAVERRDAIQYSCTLSSTSMTLSRKQVLQGRGIVSPFL